MKKKQVTRGISLILAMIIVSGCTAGKSPVLDTTEPSGNQEQADGAEAMIEYQVDPATFALDMISDDKVIPVSQPGTTRATANVVRQEGITSWDYPDEDISITIEPQATYLDVSVTANKTTDQAFDWPCISAETYYLPLGEGKRIPRTDPVWNEYLGGQELSVMEQLSMPFWFTANGDDGVLVIMENPFRSNLVFTSGTETEFVLNHEYPAIDPDRENHFRIYLMGNDPVDAAKQYRQYVKETGAFVSLEQKAQENPNIRKLYGAPHIYLWGEFLIEPEDIRWQKFLASLDDKVIVHLKTVAGQLEYGGELQTVLAELPSQDYVSEYQKNMICRAISEALWLPDFYSPELFGERSEEPEESETSRIKQNKEALAQSLPEVFKPAGEWMDHSTTGLLTELHDAGIKQAFIGLNSWEQAYGKAELADTAALLGYLIGPYDSYHSIHEPGKEQWITAAFRDKSLFENATIVDQKLEKITGFQNVGRKLNPVLSLPAVQDRVNRIVAQQPSFNAWFIDCDATGEIYDDYSPEHITTQQADVSARLERMAYIRDEHQMVIGSEGGHDFAAPVIAFAHGIELPTFSWMDEDMKSNQDSEYYMGNYFNPAGGVADRFARPIEIKDKFYQLFLNPYYDVPLYKLVYNDSVITTYHWDWSTFKIKGQEQNRMLREFLYNIPPLYHLDRTEWEKYQHQIVDHTTKWSDFSKQAIGEEMTDFEYVTEDGMVQKTVYGKDLTVVVNYGDSSYTYQGYQMEPHSLMTVNGDKIQMDSPDF